jgi:predicted  nucleic acid-binding Zn-ribbon protein
MDKPLMIVWHDEHLNTTGHVAETKDSIVVYVGENRPILPDPAEVDYMKQQLELAKEEVESKDLSNDELKKRYTEMFLTCCRWMNRAKKAEKRLGVVSEMLPYMDVLEERLTLAQMDEFRAIEKRYHELFD